MANIQGCSRRPQSDSACIRRMTESADRIFAQAEAAGLFLSDTPPRPRSSAPAYADARHWLDEADSLLPRLSAGGQLALAARYDLMHRIGRSKPADPARIDAITLEALNARLRGDVSVDQYDLFLAIRNGLSRRNPKYFGSPLKWHSQQIARWIKDFRNSVPLSDYDLQRRAALLAAEDLWAFDSDPALLKRRLASAAH